MINIQDIIPFMKPGWVAMDEDGSWCWYEKEPYIESSIVGGYWQSNACEWIPACFDIAPANDWTKSLIKVGGE
jgi:hypothetical protein